LKTLEAVLWVFADAYNRFSSYKAKYRVPVVHKSENPSRKLHKYRAPRSPLWILFNNAVCTRIGQKNACIWQWNHV
jgi:hypothetical protein